MNQKIAIPTCEGILWTHFGKAPEHEHGAMPRFIAAHACTDVLCGGLGPGAVNMLNQMGIQVHAGAPELPIEELLKLYLIGAIEYGDGSCHHDGCGGHHHGHDC